jgi:hypothetical protein
MGFEDEVVHAALLLLMLGALTTVTPFHHQPEAQHKRGVRLPPVRVRRLAYISDLLRKAVSVRDVAGDHTILAFSEISALGTDLIVAK